VHPGEFEAVDIRRCDLVGDGEVAAPGLAPPGWPAGDAAGARLRRKRFGAGQQQEG
jgi:hypothetical protein